jgi:hypothetical protein
MSFPMSTGPDGSNNTNYFPTVVGQAGAAQQQPGSSTSPFGHARSYSNFANDPSGQSMSNNMFAPDDLLYGFDDGGDQGDPKRRRIARVGHMSSLLIENETDVEV